MRTSRIFRLLFQVFITLLTLSVTVISILGGMSAFIILTNTENIGIGTDDADFNISFNMTGGLQNANFTLPFNITNAGYFDIENLQIRAEFKMNYSHVDYPILGVNGTRTSKKIFEKTFDGIDDIPKGSTGYFNLTGLFGDFLPGNFPNITNIDIFKTPPIFEFYANLTVSLDYSLGMHSITIYILNLKIGELP